MYYCMCITLLEVESLSKVCLKYFLQEVPYLQCEPCLIKSYYIAYLPSPFIIVHMVQHYLFIG